MHGEGTLITQNGHRFYGTWHSLCVEVEGGEGGRGWRVEGPGGVKREGARREKLGEGEVEGVRREKEGERRKVRRERGGGCEEGEVGRGWRCGR